MPTVGQKVTKKHYRDIANTCVQMYIMTENHCSIFHKIYKRVVLFTFVSITLWYMFVVYEYWLSVPVTYVWRIWVDSIEPMPQQNHRKDPGRYNKLGPSSSHQICHVFIYFSWVWVVHDFYNCARINISNRERTRWMLVLAVSVSYWGIAHGKESNVNSLIILARLFFFQTKSTYASHMKKMNENIRRKSMFIIVTGDIANDAVLLLFSQNRH